MANRTSFGPHIGVSPFLSRAAHLGEAEASVCGRAQRAYRYIWLCDAWRALAAGWGEACRICLAPNKL